MDPIPIKLNGERRPTLAELRARAGTVFRCPTCGGKRGVYYTRERADHKLRCYTCLDCKTKLWTKEIELTSENGNGHGTNGTLGATTETSGAAKPDPARARR
jgi:hypothetical protein